MPRAARLAPLALALLALAPDAAAQKRTLIRPPPPPTRSTPRGLLGRSAAAALTQPSRPVVTVATSTTDLDLASWPLAKLPSFTAKSAPSTLPPAPAGLRLVDTRTTTPGAKPAPVTALTRPTSVRIELEGPGVLVGGWAPDLSTHGTSLTTGCNPGQGKSAPRSFFWEILRREADGSGKLTVAEGWFEPRECRLSLGSQVEISLASVGSLDGAPLMFGARAGDGLLLLLPTVTAAGADNLPEMSGATLKRGPLSMLTLSPTRGSAVVFAGNMLHHSLNNWREGLGLAPLPDPAVGSPINIRIDVSQAVDEPSPLALLTVQKPVASEARAAPAGLAPPARLQATEGLANPFIHRF